jgi:hypothetical protein
MCRTQRVVSTRRPAKHSGHGSQFTSSMRSQDHPLTQHVTRSLSFVDLRIGYLTNAQVVRRGPWYAAT